MLRPFQPCKFIFGLLLGMALMLPQAALPAVAATRLHKVCGPSLSDGFWGLFRRDNLVSNAVTVADNLLFFGTRHGSLRAWDPAREKIVWRVKRTL